MTEETWKKAIKDFKETENNQATILENALFTSTPRYNAALLILANGLSHQNSILDEDKVKRAIKLADLFIEEFQK
jgi:hypothetical protein